jgi:hypothetical protein
MKRTLMMYSFLKKKKFVSKIAKLDRSIEVYFSIYFSSLWLIYILNTSTINKALLDIG